MRLRLWMGALMLLLLSAPALGARVPADTAAVKVVAGCRADSLDLCVSLLEPRMQLTALMQGLALEMEGGGCRVVFPAAPMVRHRMKRHPNEVKASFRDKERKEEIRPDLAPLISALNDTVARVTMGEDSARMRAYRHFRIALDREAAVVTFAVRLPCPRVGALPDTLAVVLSSSPAELYDQREFRGTSRSVEKGPDDRGLGHAPMVKDDRNRTFRLRRVVCLTPGRE